MSERETDEIKRLALDAAREAQYLGGARAAYGVRMLAIGDVATANKQFVSAYATLWKHKRLMAIVYDETDSDLAERFAAANTDHVGDASGAYPELSAAFERIHASLTKNPGAK